MRQSDFLRDLALDLVEFRTMTREEWVAEARKIAIDISKEQGSVTSVDVRERLEVPIGMDPRILGAVFRRTKKFPWKRIGWVVPENQPQAHSRPVAVWVYEG